MCQVNVPEEKDPNVLVDQDTADDAGAYLITDDLALIQTVDFFTPIVDDPYHFGQIAAANALSDIFAMGGQVKTALNIVGFPVKKLGADVLAQILQGAQDKVTEAGGVIIGGHSIDDQEPKFGLAVTGVAHPQHIYRNQGAQPGDVLVLTKPIGTGIITTAIKKRKEHISQRIMDEVVYWMSLLNKTASETLKAFDVHAVTDVTGFGLLGHSFEMVKGSNLSLEIFYPDVPLIEGTRMIAEQGDIPGGTKSNLKLLKSQIHFPENLYETEQLILTDAVTSGGLLIALPEEEADQYVDLMKKNNQFARKIGRFTTRQSKAICVTD